MGKKLAVLKIVGVAAVTVFGSSCALADDDLSVSVGLRLWSNQWQSNDLGSVSGTPVLTHLDSATKVASIPIIAIRYKEFGVSASRFTDTTYPLSDGANTSVLNRSETDLNFSYSFMPGLSGSLGLKEIQAGGTSIKGTTLAVSVSAAVGAGFGVYGIGGIGWMKTNIPSTPTLDTDYALGEIGLSYSFDSKPDALKGLSATMGYRFQKITAKSFSNGRDANETTSGPTMGIIGVF